MPPELFTHAERAYPNECVGALLGRDGVVLRAVPLENGSPTPAHAFALSAREYLRAEAVAAQTGLSLLGFYHSHPDGPAEPSTHDLELLRHFPLLVVVEVRAGVVGAVRTLNSREGR